ncbi:uncharacterized protein LOC134230044 [Saccostrea cucullata]|uniref:uncharacterized protein LOC134230044 n=1 Tax=Saccostrea cuccullata TaxID=36930 RepID=UPI002ED2A8BF
MNPFSVSCRCVSTSVKQLLDIYHLLSRMGHPCSRCQQHNTHIANATEDTIRIVLSDNNGRETTQVIRGGEYVNIPTVHGSVTIGVFLQKEDGSFENNAVTSFSEQSDRSFIVKGHRGGNVTICRTSPGTIWVEGAPMVI